MKPTNEIMVRPAITHQSHAECLRIAPIIVKKEHAGYLMKTVKANAKA
jgi:hypothetical protein